MIGKLIGAIIGKDLAEKQGGSGAGGAVKGAIAAAVVRRLGVPALLLVGGVAAYRQYRNGKSEAA